MVLPRCRVLVASCVVLGSVLPPLSAVEVTVQNDSLTDGGTAAIQLGFVDGESGAAWLTSPCDGTIVAVQVFWRSQNGTSGQSIQDSITIFADGPFPNPGPVLEVLEAPVMTDNVLNEFRFLDENNTIPLAVPVDENERFVVSFRFTEAPDGNPALPSLATDVNGCQPARNAVDEITFGWLNLCLFGASGDWVIRAVVDCSGTVPFGACCAGEVCTDGQSVSACSNAGGTYLGDGSACGGFNCLTPACCFDPKGCLDLTPGDCATLGGFTQGVGSSCANTECFPIGACCNADGTCADEVSDSDCAAAGGLFQGDDSFCGAISCPQPTGACCTAGGCVELEEASCAVVPNSTWGGALTDCVLDADMNDIPDACEGGGGGCPGGTIAECADTDRNGIRDDNCLWWECAAGTCVSTEIPFGDMGGQFGACPPDGTADGNDRFQALNCFADTNPDMTGPFDCEAGPPVAYNVDSGGQFGSCAPDGVCDGNDAFAALNAFGGTTSCSCPLGGPGPEIEPQVRGYAGLALHADRRRVRAGDVVEIDVHLTTPVVDLRGYQIHLGVDGGQAGALELVDISIRERVERPAPPHDPAPGMKIAAPARTAGRRFAATERTVAVDGLLGAGPRQGPAYEWQAFNVATGQMVAGTDGPGVGVAGGTCLATFTYRATRTAAGRFVVHGRYDARQRSDRTFLFPTAAHGRIVIDSFAAAVIEVEPATPRRAR